MSFLDDIKWNEQGLIPAIAQDVETNDVLMVAWMNEEALQLTASTGKVVYQRGGIACHTGRKSCFFQRLENEQWTKVEPVLKDPKKIYSK